MRSKKNLEVNQKGSYKISLNLFLNSRASKKEISLFKPRGVSHDRPTPKASVCSRKGPKGFSQIDFMIAMGIFLVIFASVVQFTTNFFITLREGTETVSLRSSALDMMYMADMGFIPDNWSLADYPKKIGLQTDAYRFFILVNNTLAGNIASELISFNYSDLGFSNIDYSSTSIYDESSNTVAYQISGSNITFNTTMLSSQVKWFTVYFDDDSNFTSMSSSVSGTNNLTETLYPVQEISLLQYRKIMKLNGTDYEKMKNSTSMNAGFRITLLNEANSTIFDYGGTLPKSSTIISLKRRVLMQNSTAGIRYGSILVRIW
jgi:hypothetical protein